MRPKHISAITTNDITHALSMLEGDLKKKKKRRRRETDRQTDRQTDRDRDKQKQ